jgi:NTP pyrophosphatase (non-canonical NTP hydrolase)
MTLDEYQKAAARTASWDTTHEIRQATFSLGLVCEATEVLELFDDGPGPTPMALTKELGDVMWYTAGLCTEHDMSLAEVVGRSFEQLDIEMFSEQPPAERVRQLVVLTGKVSDYMKKVLGHGHALDRERLAGGLQAVFLCLHTVCQGYGLVTVEVAEANIKKLMARYPQGFTTADSVNRKA